MDAQELKNVIEELGAAFSEYKKTNDDRLNELAKGGDAGELEAKLSKLEGDLKRLEAEKGELEAKINRPGPIQGSDKEDAEYRKAFDSFVRKGRVSPELEEKAMSAGSDPDGGYAVPSELSRNIYALMEKATPMRSVSRVITVSTSDYSELVSLHGADAGWVGETDPRPVTNTPQIAKLSPFNGEVYANPSATQTALDDLFFDVEQFLADEIARVFSIKESLAFTSGDGDKKPKGFLAYPNAETSDNDARPFGTLQFLSTGVADNFASTAPSDTLIDTIHALKQGHRLNARWMMNTLTLATIRKWKDSENNYLWQPGLQIGQPSALLGYPVTENADMPSVGANALPVAFGDFAVAYTIVDRIGIRMLRDPYTNKPYVSFYTTKRTGGFLKDSEAIKLIKCAAAA